MKTSTKRTEKKMEARTETPFLTTDQGIGISNTDDSLKAGPRGPTLLEDFHLREKIMRFDHERIPERAVHARGAAAHGYFQVYEPMKKYTKAAFLQDSSVKTPVFVRFSTVAGSRGSADTARDVRGFATKFYTSEGNYDLVGNNMPVFFIQDGIKFPDLIHSVKGEPHNEIPQAASAHDTFWDFASLTPETTHMLMWVMSDRAIPRSFATMEGFGVHTFRFINDAGKSMLVKFHWKPILGMRSLIWDEAKKIAGQDPDFHRRDLFESIARGDYPEYELGVQLIEEKDVLKYGFDLLDATKLLPEELVPIKKIGKMTLNRNPDNYFAETEQVAYCVGNIVPGIDFTNDPLLQVRLFSYLDTQLSRLGSPNFADLPINRPKCPVNNHQQDGHMQGRIHTSEALYHPNSVGGGCPFLSGKSVKGESYAAFEHYTERLDGSVIRERSGSFKDHFSQAKLFFDSQTPVEQQHIIQSFQFELGKVERKEIRERMLGNLAKVDSKLAQKVSEKLGVNVPFTATQSPSTVKAPLSKDSTLSIEAAPRSSVKGMCLAVLIADGVKGEELNSIKKSLESSGARIELIAPFVGAIKTAEGKSVEAKKTLLTTSSVLFDGVYIPGGKKSIDTLLKEGEALHFINESYKHFKTVAASGEGCLLLEATAVPSSAQADPGVVRAKGSSDWASFPKSLNKALSQHRHWARETQRVPA